MVALRACYVALHYLPRGGSDVDRRGMAEGGLSALVDAL